MINNLFSVFDPSSSSLSLCWLTGLFIILIIPQHLWFSTPSHLKRIKKFSRFLLKEVSFNLNKTKKRELASILILFILIFLINFTALFPQVFSLTSHLVFTLPLALVRWLTVNLFGWLKNLNHILSHLVPQGTPVVLIRFIVIIEITRRLIRPITLCVRLTANLIAGHLLITLLGNALLSLRVLISISFILIPLILTVLETAVAAIQSYVFMTLITLYVTEVK